MIRKGDLIEMIILDFIEGGTQNAWSKHKKEFALRTYKLYYWWTKENTQ